MVKTRGSSKKSEEVVKQQHQLPKRISTPSSSKSLRRRPGLRFSNSPKPADGRRVQATYKRRRADLGSSSSPDPHDQSNAQPAVKTSIFQISEAAMPPNIQQKENAGSNNESRTENVNAIEQTMQLQLRFMPEEIVTHAGNRSDELHFSEEIDPPLKALYCNTPAIGMTTRNADEISSTVASSNINKGSELSSSNCFLGNSYMHQATSFNLTEIAEGMGNDDSCEVESFRVDATSVTVGGYRVKTQYAELLGQILSQHGDIAANCSLKSITVRSFCLEILCEILQKLKDSSFSAITESMLEDMLNHVHDFENAGIEIGWIKNRLAVISEAKQAIQLLTSSTSLKHHRAEWKSKIQDMLKLREAYIREFELKKTELEDIQKKINANTSDISLAKIEARKVEKVISENKDKLRDIIKLETLADGFDRVALNPFLNS